jgi:hypothetical protein
MVYNGMWHICQGMSGFSFQQRRMGMDEGHSASPLVFGFE